MSERTPNAADAPELRPLLARSLRRDGFGALYRAEPRSYQAFSTRFSYVMMSALTAGVVNTLSDWLNLAGYSWLGLLALVLALLLLITALLSPGVAAVVVLAIWAGFLVVQIIASDGDAFSTHGIPFGITAAVVWIADGRRLNTVARLSPLLLPVTLTVLLIPLFTDDLWEAATHLQIRHFLLLGMLTVVPLLVLLSLRIGREIPTNLRAVGNEVLRDPAGAADRCGDKLVSMVDEDDQTRASRSVQGPMKSLYAAKIKPRHVERVADAVAASLRRRIPVRLLWTGLGLGTAVTAYMYLLAWVLVPGEVAERWTQTQISAAHLNLIILEIDAPGGAYLVVSSLLGVVATAVLLAFVLTEEHYGSTLTDAVLRRPLHVGMEAALPYVVLAEENPTAPHGGTSWPGAQE